MSGGHSLAYTVPCGHEKRTDLCGTRLEAWLCSVRMGQATVTYCVQIILACSQKLRCMGQLLEKLVSLPLGRGIQAGRAGQKADSSLSSFFIF